MSVSYLDSVNRQLSFDGLSVGTFIGFTHICFDEEVNVIVRFTHGVTDGDMSTCSQLCPSWLSV